MDKQLTNDTVIKQAVLYRGDAAGNIVSFEQGGQRQIGYWLGQAYWGKGIATQALSQFPAHAEVRPLYAHVVSHNSASIRVLEKSGFSKVGDDRSHNQPDD